MSAKPPPASVSQTFGHGHCLRDLRQRAARADVAEALRILGAAPEAGDERES
jgi:hypothetical protein